jgi:lipopolysaccharide transport system ATP-binding protein
MSMPSDAHSFNIGIHQAKMWLPRHLLNEGCYDLQVAVMTISPQVVHFAVDQAIFFYVSENVHDPARHGYVHKLAGFFRPRLQWEIV